MLCGVRMKTLIVWLCAVAGVGFYAGCGGEPAPPPTVDMDTTPIADDGGTEPVSRTCVVEVNRLDDGCVLAP